LFDGNGTSHWNSTSSGAGVSWQSTNGMLTALTNAGNLRTAQEFVDYRLHLEFMIPPTPAGTAEGALGNSGVFLQGQYEVQIMDSFGRPISGAHETGAIYNQRN